MKRIAEELRCALAKMQGPATGLCHDRARASADSDQRRAPRCVDPTIPSEDLSMRLYRSALSCGLCIALALSGCRDRDVGDDVDRSAVALSQPAAAGELSDWPKVDSAIKPDAAIEARIKEILAGMSLAQKIGRASCRERVCHNV